MLTKCFGEFMGTLMPIALGNGVVANLLLRRPKAEGAGWMMIASAWAFAVMAGVFTRDDRLSCRGLRDLHGRSDGMRRWWRKPRHSPGRG
jgi:hypothetical protein